MKPNLHHQAENSSFSIFSSYYYDDEFPYSDNLHFHKNYEIINIIEGTCEITYQKKTFTLTEGDAILIKPFVFHGIVLKKNAKVRCAVSHKLLLYTLANYIDGYTPSTPIFRPSEKVIDYYNSELMRCFGKEPSVSEHLPSDKTLAVKGCLYAIGGEFLRQVSLIPSEKSNDSIIQDIIDYIAKNYTADISLHDIARELGYSYHYLSRIFNCTLGINFKTLLNIYRADYSIALLQNTPMQIGEIAYKCGFQTIRSFNECCKKLYDKTPSEIRKISKVKGVYPFDNIPQN